MAIRTPGLKLSLHEYGNQKGNQCPFCLEEGSTWTVATTQSDEQSGSLGNRLPRKYVIQRRACTECGESWDDEYQIVLVGIKWEP